MRTARRPGARCRRDDSGPEPIGSGPLLCVWRSGWIRGESAGLTGCAAGLHPAARRTPTRATPASGRPPACTPGTGTPARCRKSVHRAPGSARRIAGRSRITRKTSADSLARCHGRVLLSRHRQGKRKAQPQVTRAPTPPAVPPKARAGVRRPGTTAPPASEPPGTRRPVTRTRHLTPPQRISPNPHRRGRPGHPRQHDAPGQRKSVQPPHHRKRARQPHPTRGRAAATKPDGAAHPRFNL